MSKKLKILLTCLAAVSLMGVVAACETEETPETVSSSTSSSVPAESTPEESSPEESSPEVPEVTKYTVKFVDYDDRVISEKEYEEGETVEKPADPERADAEGYKYTFTGWDNAVTETATANITYKATYSKVAIEYKVVFKADGVQVGETLKYTVENKEIDEPAVPAKDYYNGAWGAYELNGGNVEVNAVYTAIEYDVVFKADGVQVGEVLKYTVENKEIAEPAVPTKDHYNGVWGTYELNAGNVEVNAVYTAIEYDVVFKADGAQIGEVLKYTVENKEIAEPSVPAKDHYNGAWGAYELNGGNVEVNAVYTAIEYDVVFKADGVQVGEVLKYTVENKEIAEPAVPSKNGYTGEWAKYELNGGNVEVNAEYKAIEYKVVFLDEDGSILGEKADYHYGDAVEAPSAPEKASTTVYEFTFAGWDKETVAVTEDATYTAVYTATLKAGYKVNEGSAGAGESIVLNQSGIGGGANYTLGQNNDDGDETPSFVKQSYLAIDGDYNLNDYVAFDFTGKNLPEIAFFAKNYNDSMYAEGTSKQGIVVVTGITTWDGQLGSGVNGNGTQINYGFPYMIQDAASGNFVEGAFANSALGRANLVDGTHYRVIMGFTEHAESARITLKWCLYNLDTNTVVEESSMSSWGFFTGSNAQAGNMTRDQLSGSIVLYGKFGVETTIDKLHGVYKDTNIGDLAAGLSGEKTYTVTFKDANGNELKKVENLNFGASISYDEALPTPDKAEDALFTYSYAWDKEFAPVYSDAVYTLKLVSTAKSGYNASNVTANGDAIILGASGIGDGANYSLGQNNGGYVNQAYLGIDGNYGLNNYVVFDFTGKNMPEVAFFAKNYNNSMYAEGTSKQGIVVVTGITTWDGQLGSGVNSNGTQINYGFPYMIQDAASGNFVEGAFANSALGRANLVDGTHYRVIMGFTEHAESARITLKWCLYNLDTNTVVEESSMSSWGFFTGSNAQVGNMTRDQLSGSIVLYGKFGVETTIDKLYNVESGTFSDVVTEYTA